MHTYTTSELAKISGISADQLKEWDRSDMLRPERILRKRGRSHERRYSREQALGVIALGELKRGGVSGPRVRAAAALLPLALSDYAYLVFDGRLIYPKLTAAEAGEFLSHIPTGGRVLKVAPLLDKLA